MHQRGHGPDDEALERLLKEVLRRLANLERGRPQSVSIEGERTDDPAGDGSNWGTRVVVGKLSDGSYGIERWLADGTGPQKPTWS
jgi:hypothetical protein